MGRKKDKWFKKTINYYRYIFKFEAPFKIIVDGNFIAVAHKKKFDMKEALSKALDEKVHLVIPTCVFRELQSIEDKIPGITSIISEYKIEECPHNQMEPVNCIRSYIGKRNNTKYFVATQDKFLRSMLRKVPGVPLIFFDQNMILIDKLSSASLAASERREELKEDPKKKEKKVLNEKKKEIKEFLLQEVRQSKRYKERIEEYKLNRVMGRIKKKAKGPNPLSVKKKRSYYERREKEREWLRKQREAESAKNEISNNNFNDNNIEEKGNNNESNKKEAQNEFIKKKRKRHRKKKTNNQIEE